MLMNNKLKVMTYSALLLGTLAVGVTSNNDANATTVNATPSVSQIQKTINSTQKLVGIKPTAFQVVAPTAIADDAVIAVTAKNESPTITPTSTNQQILDAFGIKVMDTKNNVDITDDYINALYVKDGVSTLSNIPTALQQNPDATSYTLRLPKRAGLTEGELQDDSNVFIFTAKVSQTAPAEDAGKATVHFVFLDADGKVDPSMTADDKVFDGSGKKAGDTFKIDINDYIKDGWKLTSEQTINEDNSIDGMYTNTAQEITLTFQKGVVDPGGDKPENLADAKVTIQQIDPSTGALIKTIATETVKPDDGMKAGDVKEFDVTPFIPKGLEIQDKSVLNDKGKLNVIFDYVTKNYTINLVETKATTPTDPTDPGDDTGDKTPDYKTITYKFLDQNGKQLIPSKVARVYKGKATTLNVDPAQFGSYKLVSVTGGKVNNNKIVTSYDSVKKNATITLKFAPKVAQYRNVQVTIYDQDGVALYNNMIKVDDTKTGTFDVNIKDFANYDITSVKGAKRSGATKLVLDKDTSNHIIVHVKWNGKGTPAVAAQKVDTTSNEDSTASGSNSAKSSSTKGNGSSASGNVAQTDADGNAIPKTGADLLSALGTGLTGIMTTIGGFVGYKRKH